MRDDVTNAPEHLETELSRLKSRVTQLETELEASNRLVQRVRASESRYRGLVERSLGLICVHDREGKVLEINPAAAAALEYEPLDLVGMNVRDHLAASVRDLFPAYTARILREGQDSGIMRLITKSGDEAVWSYRNILVERSDDEPYVIGNAHDITVLDRTRAALRKARAALKERVGRRTNELTEANRRLRIEISERELVEEALRLSRNRLKLLNEIAFFDGDGLSLDEIVERILQFTSRYFPTVWVFFAGAESHSGLLMRHAVAQASERPSFGNDSWLDVSPSHLEAVLRGDSLVLEDASMDVIRDGALVGGSAWHVGALMGVPVRRNEDLYGLVGFAASGMRRWTDHELTVVRELAGYLSMVLRKA